MGCAHAWDGVKRTSSGSQEEQTQQPISSVATIFVRTNRDYFRYKTVSGRIKGFRSNRRSFAYILQEVVTLSIRSCLVSTYNMQFGTN
jgi:hypothetical protein